MGCQEVLSKEDIDKGKVRYINNSELIDYYGEDQNGRKKAEYILPFSGIEKRDRRVGKQVKDMKDYSVKELQPKAIKNMSKQTLSTKLN